MKTDRYARQIILPEIGPEGQQRFAQTKLLYIGVGGLGSPALLYSAAAGIGTIGIVDRDKVDITNLHRQIIFTEADKDRPKVVVAKEKLLAINPNIKVNIYEEYFAASNAIQIMQNYDIIVDGTDNFASKFLINDCAVKLSKPVVYASVLGFDGQLSVFDANQGACYRCLYKEPPSLYVPNCAEAGVLGAVVGMLGTAQAVEILKLALGPDICQRHDLIPLVNQLWQLDAKSMAVKILKISKNSNCPVCSIAKNDIILNDLSQNCADDSEIKSLTRAEIPSNHNLLIIDVRQQHEWDSGHIDGAVHIPLARILDHPDEIKELAKSTPLLIYCQHGIRSLTAAKFLKTLGFISVANLKGGLVAWDGIISNPSGATEWA